MRRLLAFVAVLLMLGATVGQASTITVDTVRTVYSGSLDKLMIYLSGYEGIPSDAKMGGMEGTWSVVGAGAGISLKDTDEDATWQDYTKGYPTPAAGISYVKFDLTIDNNPPAPTLWTRTAGVGADMYSDFSGSWFTTTDLRKKTPTAIQASTGLIAALYVSTGADVEFSGKLQFSGATGVITTTFSTQMIPEPGTVALLASGLIGLLIAAWRRKR